MMNKIRYEQTTEFQKDLKGLLKKYPSLESDIELAKTHAIELFHVNKINNLSVFPIPNFCRGDIQIYKIKKFACRSLKGRGNKSGIRIIYAFNCTTLQVTFIEIYFKGDKENEDRARVEEWMRSMA